MQIVDLHCDTISAIYERNEQLYENNGHFDIKRAIEAGIKIQVFALFTRPTESSLALRQILKLVDKYHLELEKNTEFLYMLKRYANIEEPGNENKIGCLLHLEGGEAIGIDLEVLRTLYRLGLRSLGLTWNDRNQLADGLIEGDQAGGVSKKGREVLGEMNRLGILLDLSHLSVKGFYEAFECYQHPILVSHANALALCGHWRNLNDQQLRTLAENGGVVGINQVADFVKVDGNCMLEDLIDHIVYIAELIGIEHVGLGSDFDGADQVVLPGVEEYKRLEPALIKRGFTTEEVNMILGGNALRVIKKVLG